MLFRLAVLFMVLGYGSAMLHFTDLQFKVLMWAEPAQPVLGLLLGAGGTALLVFGFVRADKSKQAGAQPMGTYGQGPAPASPQPYGAPHPGSQQPAPGQPVTPGFPGPGGAGQPGQWTSPQQYGPSPQYGSPQQSGAPQQYGSPPQYGPPQQSGAPQQYGSPQQAPPQAPHGQPLQHPPGHFGQR